VLQTEDPFQVSALQAYLQTRATEKTEHSVLPVYAARVVSIEAVGMGERVCVDLCTLMAPGEGLLVGSFARGLFLVHSECLVSDYVASRPFRVNAGPVCSYVATPDNKTAYLSELRCGAEVLVVEQSPELKFRTRTAVVGRAKVERRPMVKIEAEVVEEKGDGSISRAPFGQRERLCIVLQNAETVRLMSAMSPPIKASTISVADLKVGDLLSTCLQPDVARHTGIAIDEFILEQ